MKKIVELTQGTRMDDAYYYFDKAHEVMNEDVAANSVAGGGIDFAPTAHGMKFKPINATDRRHKKKTVLLKRFRDYIKQNG